NRQMLINYYKERLNYNNIVISISGNTRVKEAIEVLQKINIPIENGFKEKRIEEVTFNPKKKVLRKKGLSHAYLCIAYPGVSLNSDSLISLILISCVLGYGYSSILFKKFRDEMNFVYSIYSNLLTYSECGLFIVQTSTVNSFSSELPSLIDQEIKKKVKEGIVSDELNKGIAALKTKLYVGLENSKQRMFEAGKKLIMDIKNNLDGNNNEKLFVGIENSKQRMFEAGKKLILDIKNNLDVNDYEKLFDQVNLTDLNKVSVKLLLESPTILIVKGSKED